MSKTISYPRSTLAGLIESESDSGSDDAHYEDQSTMMTPQSGTESMTPAKKVRGRPKGAVAKVTKAKITPAKKGRRPALKDRTNAQSASSDTEEVENLEELEDTTINETMISVDELNSPVMRETPIRPPTKAKPAAKPAAKPTIKPAAKPSKTAKAKSEKTDSKHDEITIGTPKLGSKTSLAPKKANPRKRQRQEEPELSETEIPETQEAPMDDYGDEEVEEPTPKAVVRKAILPRSSTSHSRQTSVARQRAGSVSDNERHDPALRRKVKDLTTKLENLDLKYRNLRELGIQEAEDIFEKHKKQSEESKKAANALIASLKNEVATQNAQIKESRALKKRLEAQDSEISKLQGQLAQLSTSLSEAQTENKTLSTKLAANRAAAASVESINKKTPGSAVKAAGTIRLMGSAEVAEAAQAAQLKENLYSDLTGLIIRSVKREDEEDVFDCIQTGRNGTLHFKFGVPNDKGMDADDEAQCQYVPQLDPSRDKDLKELLPEYLTDELMFPRPQVDRFYARVIKALTEVPN